MTIPVDTIDAFDPNSELGKRFAGVMYDSRTKWVAGFIDHERRFVPYTGEQPPWPWPSRGDAWVEQGNAEE